MYLISFLSYLPLLQVVLMLAIIVFVFMITCMSYIILIVLSSPTSGGSNVGHNCVCIHDNLYVLSYLILPYLSLFQVVRLLAILVFYS